MDRYLMGIDNGGTLTKASIFDEGGREIAVSCRRTRLEIPKPGYSVRDMNKLWEANIKVIKEVLAKSGIEPELIEGISVTGHGNGLYLLDENGKPTYDGIYSSDTRAKDIAAKWYGNGVFDRVHPKIQQALWAGQPIVLLAWLKENCPEVLNKTRWILLCKDYIRYCLTGEIYAEITDLSGSNLLNNRDEAYDGELLKEFGLEDISGKLPPIRYSSDICGYITQTVSELTGLRAGTPVAGGMFDIDACAIATGIVNEDKVCITAGTWNINQYITDFPIVSKDLFLNTLYCIKGYHLITEASPTSASNLEWFIEQFLEEEEKDAKENGRSVYEICEEITSGIKPEENNIIFLPFLFGSNVEADAKACFIGLQGSNTKKHLLRAVYEGVVLCHLYHFERLMAFRKKPETVRISGGASKSREWVQIFADAMQIPVEVMSGSELGALGAAICAGVAVKVFSSYEDAAVNMVQVSYTAYPNPDKKLIYEKKYAAYKSIIKQLASVWGNL